MKITNLTLRNFLSFGDKPEEITFTPSTTVVGPNDVGKTNLFRALDLLHDLLLNPRLDVQPFYNLGITGKELEIRVDLRFNELEAQALTDFAICSCLTSTVSGTGQERTQMVWDLRKNVVLEQGRTLFDRLFSETSLVISGAWQESNPPTVRIRVKGNGRILSIDRPGAIHKESTGGSIFSGWTLPQLFIDTLRATNKSVAEFLSVNSHESIPPKVVVADIFSLVGTFLDSDSQVSRAVSIDGFRAGNVEASLGDRPEFRRLSKFMRSRGYHDAYLDLFSVISTIFSSSIIRVSSLRALGEAYLELTPTQPQTGSSYYLDGTSLPLALFHLRNSTQQKDLARFKRIHGEFRNLAGGKEFDIKIRPIQFSVTAPPEVVTLAQPPGSIAQPTYPAGGGDVSLIGTRTRNLPETRYLVEVHVHDTDVVIPLEFAAAGTFETLLLSTALFALEDSIVLLDEPALNLHPIRQRHLLDSTRLSNSQYDNQVIMITHSPYLVDQSTLNTTWRVSQTEGRTTVLSLATTFEKLRPNEVKRAALRLGNPELRAVLFARGVILVEGLSDKIVIQTLDRNSDSKLEGNEWAVVDVGGKESLPLYATMANALGIPFAAVIDNDASKQRDKLLLLGAKGVFVFQTDLEGALNEKGTGKEGKPLQALDSLIEDVSNKEVSSELRQMISFLQDLAMKYS